MLITVSTLVKLKIKIKDKFYIKKNIFQLLISRMHNFQNNISFYNSIISALRILVIISQTLMVYLLTIFEMSILNNHKFMSLSFQIDATYYNRYRC